jgi:hypothetical protein
MCSGCIELIQYSKMTQIYLDCREVGLNTCSLKRNRLDYLTVPEITAVSINTAPQRLALISWSLSLIVWMLDLFFL